MLLSISLLHLSLFTVFIYFLQIQRAAFHIKCTALLSMLGLTFAVVAFYIEPLDPGWDLAAHYRLIEQMRETGTMNVPLANAVYGTEPLTKLLHYIVSCMPSNHFFQFIAIITEFSMLTILCHDIQIKLGFNNTILSLFIIIIFALCPIYQYVSGIRTTLATSFFTYALYRDLFLKKKNLYTVLFYATAVSIHSFCLILIILRFVFIFKKIFWKYRYAFIFWGIGLVPIALFFKILSTLFPYFNKFYNMVQAYSHNGAKPILTTNFKYDVIRLFVIIFLLVLAETANNYTVKNHRHNSYNTFFIIVCYFSLGSVAVYHLFDRMCIVLAWNSLLPLCNIFKTFSPKFERLKTVLHFGILIGCGLLFMFNLRHMTVFSRLTFN